VYAAGAPYGITPYGTEAMHVLRAEKGYIAVGQDTYGTVTPADAGLGWALSGAKHYIGERSLRRPDTARADRKQLVDLHPSVFAPGRCVQTNLAKAQVILSPGG
jgi:sarcosine oxidase subunit alpha